MPVENMPAENVELATLMVALEELDVSLHELRELFEAEDRSSWLALQRLEEDGGDLVRLDAMLAEWLDEVDVFDALGLHDDEQFHSNLLSWLLDPRGSHGLGDHFLQGFLVASGASGAISAVNRPSATIRREKSLQLDDGDGLDICGSCLGLALDAVDLHGFRRGGHDRTLRSAIDMSVTHGSGTSPLLPVVARPLKWVTGEMAHRRPGYTTTPSAGKRSKSVW